MNDDCVSAANLAAMRANNQGTAPMNEAKIAIENLAKAGYTVANSQLVHKPEVAALRLQLAAKDAELNVAASKMADYRRLQRQVTDALQIFEHMGTSTENQTLAEVIEGYMSIGDAFVASLRAEAAAKDVTIARLNDEVQFFRKRLADKICPDQTEKAE